VSIPFSVAVPVERTGAERVTLVRRTYGLVFVSVIVTILGAGFGMSQPALMQAVARHYFISFLCVLAPLFLAMKWQRDYPRNIGLTFLFTFAEGVWLSPLLFAYNRAMPGVVGQAGVLTLSTFGVLSLYAILSKRDFSAWGGFFTIGLWVLLATSLLNLFFRNATASLWLAGGTVLVFGGLLVFDTWRIVRSNQYGPDDYVAAAVSIYLDLLNLFLAILQSQIAQGCTGQGRESAYRSHALLLSRRRVLISIMRVLTGIYAHPDDETFSGGGTYAKYAAAGARCTIFCATDGDAGKTSGLNVASKQELGALRRRELEAAARILGIQFVESAGHPDGALGAVDQQELIGQIVRHLRRERPQVVIAFGPEGAPNTHPDHRVVSRAATAAFFLAANASVFAEQLKEGLQPHAPARLFYVTWPEPAARAVLQTRGVPATARIDVRRFRDKELAAFRAHVSQQALEQRFEETAATDEECFALAAGSAQPSALVDDLFAGL
jgi:LmbE family N-acetylglucosaminyl deacetylase/FtsH-binding integral membrane protein